jgi:membrane-associated phospholipid phosphatase
MATPSDSSSNTLQPVDRVHLAFYVLVLAISVARIGALPEPWKPLAWYGFAAAATLAQARSLRGRTGMRATLARCAFTFVVAPISFLMLAFVVPYANPFHGERLLHAVDTWLFLGRNPNVLLDSIAWPPLTELLQWVYGVYYAIPVVLLVAMIARRSPAGISRCLFDVLLCLYLSYVGYFLLPATGPNLNVLGLYPSHFDQPMEGVWAAERLRASLLEAEWIKHDCWPSGHTALSFTCLVLARREGARWAFWTLLAPVTLLIFSTMYLRYHYVTDVLFGFLLAWAVLRWAPSLRRRLERT